MKALKSWHIVVTGIVTIALVLVYCKLMIPFYDENMVIRVTDNFSWSPGIAIPFWVNMSGSILFGGIIAYFSSKQVLKDYDWKERILFCIAMIMLLILVTDIAFLILPKTFIEYRFSQPLFNSAYSFYMYSISLPLIMLSGYLIKAKSLDIWIIISIICFAFIGGSLTRNVVYGLAHSLGMFFCLIPFLAGMLIKKLTRKTQEDK